VDEHPVAGLQLLVLEQADVDDPPDARDVDAGQVLVVEHLDQPSGDPEAHGATSRP
jgi:hypothetical protein